MKAYNHYRQYHRSESKREAREIIGETERVMSAEQSYEGYCAALGVDVKQARGASHIGALAAYVSDDPISRALNK